MGEPSSTAAAGRAGLEFVEKRLPAKLTSTNGLGVTLDQRVCEVELEGLDVPDHVAELVRACWELGARPSLATLRLRKWAHMLGFGGHFSTNSRRYSTTLVPR